MWPFTLSGRLLIVAVVGRYLTKKLIRRGPLPYHRSFSHRTMRYCALMRFYQPFPAAIPRYGAGCPRVTHPSATKCIGDSAEASSVIHSVRLACVKHAASVHPEPGSNSHVLILVLDKQLAAIYSLIYCTFYKFENFLESSGSYCYSVVNVLYSLYRLQDLEKIRTEKEGFEPSRRD